MNKMIIFSELTEALAEKANTSKTVASVFIRELFATASARLIAGEDVTIDGIGKFSPEIVDGSVSVKFIPDSSFLEEVNSPFEQFEPVEIGENFDDSILDDTNDTSPIEEIADIQSAPIISTESDEDDNFDDLCGESVDDEEIEYPADMPTPPSFLAIAQPVAAPIPAPILSESEPTPGSEPIAESAPEPVPVGETEPDNLPSSSDSLYDYDDEPKRRAFSWGSFFVGLVVGSLITAGIFLFVNNRNVTSATTNSDNESVSDTLAVATEMTNPSDSIPKDTIAVPEQVRDTITKRRFLATMAREHYGNAAFWVYIYEENKNMVGPNPNRIKPGTEVIIPPAEKYGIDANNPESIERAKQKAKELSKK